MDDTRRRALWWALRSRVLTDEEMLEVEQSDWGLAVPAGAGYFEHEVKIEFMTALLNQFRMRVAATKTEER